MKKLLFLFLIVLCCACEEDKSIDPTLMPEATSMGKNTLGCLIDGWLYTGGRLGMPTVRAYNEEDNHYITIDVEVDVFTHLSFTLVNPLPGNTCTYTNAVFAGEALEDGEAYITRMNGSILSGTFSGGNVKEGRFDLKYQDESEGGDVI